MEITELLDTESVVAKLPATSKKQALQELAKRAAQITGLEAHEFIHSLGDAHIYLNHLDQADEQLTREPLPLPKLAIRRRPPSIFDYRYEDFEILGYEAHPHIKAAVAV